MVDHIAAGLELLHEWRAFTQRDYSMSLTEQLRLAAKCGDVRAKRAIASRLWDSPRSDKPARIARPVPPAPAKTKNQIAAEQRSAAIVRRLERESQQTGIPWQYVGSHRDSLYVEKRSARS